MLLVRRRLQADLGHTRLWVAAVAKTIFGVADNCWSSMALSKRSGPSMLFKLSVALGLKRAGLVTVFVAADQKLCRVDMLEGFAVTNPEQPASIVI